MRSPAPRVVTLVLCTGSGEVLGALPPFAVQVPWWQDADAVVRGARERHGLTVTVLRLLSAGSPSPPGGAVTYLAEVEGAPPRTTTLQEWDGELTGHPCRLGYAEPGGPARDLAWAATALAERGFHQVADAEQIRTWNLSSLWRIPVEGESLWLKCVPPFFAHEGSVLARLQGSPVPELVAEERGRVLMREVPGADQYEAPLPTLLNLVSMLVDIQAEWVGKEADMLALGLPDWRPPALEEAIDSVARRNAQDLPEADRRALRTLLDTFSERFAGLAACGIPDSLVHGDFAPGNARGDERHLVLMDWGDCGVGHPLFDQSAYLDRIPAELVPAVKDHWNSRWQDAISGSDPERAVELLAPLAAARMAVIYQSFLDAIEPSEYAYHRHDPARWLGRAAELVRE